MAVAGHRGAARERRDLRPERPGGPGRPELHGRLHHVDAARRHRPRVQHPLGYPQKYDITQYGCTDGDVFLKGALKGRLTIAADNNIDIIGNLTYNGGAGGSDLLGLVANNYVEIYHPVGDCGSGSSPCDNGSKVNGYYNLDDVAGGLTTSFNNPNVNAAILSVNHSFRVQNYQYGDNTPLGTIAVYGAIAQEYRGLVGTAGNSGYLKNYSYDQRMKYQSPPFFLNPIDSAWQIVTWVECKGTQQRLASRPPASDRSASPCGADAGVGFAPSWTPPCARSSPPSSVSPSGAS